MGMLKTIWKPCVFRTRPSVPLSKVANEVIWFFHRKNQWRRINVTVQINLVVVVVVGVKGVAMATT